MYMSVTNHITEKVKSDIFWIGYALAPSPFISLIGILGFLHALNKYYVTYYDLRHATSRHNRFHIQIGHQLILGEVFCNK